MLSLESLPAPGRPRLLRPAELFRWRPLAPTIFACLASSRLVPRGAMAHRWLFASAGPAGVGEAEPEYGPGNAGCCGSDHR